MLKPADDFRQGIAIVLRAAERIDDALKAEMKRDRSDVDWSVGGDVIGRGDHGGRNSDGIPNFVRRVITDLDPIRTARVRYRKKVTAGKRLYCRSRFFDSLMPQHPKV